MVPLSFSTSFRFVMVLFIFLTIKGSIAHSDDQAKRTTVVNDARNGYAISLSVEKEVMDDVPAPAAAELNKYGGMRGRKMMIERKNTKEKSKQVESKNSSSGAASASTHSVGNLKLKGQGKLRELSGRSSPSSHSVKSNTGSFVALNADYHMAKPHPPKNN
ncbi:hypothetical protein FXO38_08195 [Capsicum annuum]|nr:hypothetical protein FXO37_14221 [Capsicum annuum]KAF3668265.1 hypothetical protein FXO38_08195 [Capsicum annuum]